MLNSSWSKTTRARRNAKVLLCFLAKLDSLVCLIQKTVLNEAVVLILFSRISSNSSNQRWSRGHKARGQGQAQKKMRRHGHEPRTQAKVFSKTSSKFFFSGDLKEKKVFKTFFQAISKTKKGIQNIFSGDLQNKKKVFKIFFQVISEKKVIKKFCFQAICKILAIRKIVLFSSRGQRNFRGLEASRPRTSKCVLETKDILKDSTSGSNSCTDKFHSHTE